MAIHMQRVRFTFQNLKGLQEQFQSVFMGGGRVQSAEVVLQGFDISFGNGEHPVLQERIALEVNAINGAFVNVLAFFLLRDNSRDSRGNVDDPIFGTIDALVIADVA